jgi:hypothetical protein
MSKPEQGGKSSNKLIPLNKVEMQYCRQESVYNCMVDLFFV